MSLLTILEDILPTKWSRYIAGLTMLSVLPVSRLPLYWPLSTLVTTNTEIQLFRALLSVSTILIGALCCLALIIRDYHKKAKEYKTAIEFKNKKNGKDTIGKTIHDKPLDEIAIKILLFLWKQQAKITDKEISQALSFDFQIVKFHLVELEEYKMIHGTLAAGQPRLWSLVQEGRKYLIKDKLIS